MKFIELQKCFEQVDFTAIERTYEEALKHFGHENIDLWLAYFEFTAQSHKEDPQRVYDLYWKALKELDEDLKEDFSQKFNLFKLKLEGNTQIEDSDID